MSFARIAESAVWHGLVNGLSESTTSVWQNTFLSATAVVLVTWPIPAVPQGGGDSQQAISCQIIESLKTGLSGIERISYDEIAQNLYFHAVSAKASIARTWFVT